MENKLDANRKINYVSMTKINYMINYTLIK